MIRNQVHLVYFSLVDFVTYVASCLDLSNLSHIVRFVTHCSMFQPGKKIEVGW